MNYQLKDPMKLIFVYNADAGLFNTITDIAHKVISPKTYSCNLCALTHGYFSVRDNWVSFIEGLGVDCEFLHRDEFRQQYSQQSVELPAIYARHDGRLEVLLAAADIDSYDSIESLKSAISEKLRNLPF